MTTCESFIDEKYNYNGVTVNNYCDKTVMSIDVDGRMMVATVTVAKRGGAFTSDLYKVMCDFIDCFVLGFR